MNMLQVMLGLSIGGLVGWLVAAVMFHEQR